MLYRFAGSHLALFLIAVCVLIGAAGVMTEQVEFLVENYHLNFVPAETQLEENIAILIAAFGVFLEHRRYLLEQIHPDGIPEPMDRLDRYAHRAGVMFILVAVLIEAVNLLFLALNTWTIEFAGLKYAEIGLLFVLNLGACAMLIAFGRHVARMTGEG